MFLKINVKVKSHLKVNLSFILEIFFYEFWIYIEKRTAIPSLILPYCVTLTVSYGGQINKFPFVHFNI